MKPTEQWQRPPARPDRIVEVDSSEFAELLISRRKLERLFDASDRVRDLETHEIFVRRVVSEARLAKGP